MEISVTKAHGVPEDACVAFRVGDKLLPVVSALGEWAHLDVDAQPKYFEVEILQKIGSAQVLFADLVAGNGLGKEVHGSFDVEGTESHMRVNVTVESTVDQVRAQEAISPRALQTEEAKQVALEAKQYLAQHQVQPILRSLVHSILSAQPEDPKSFMISYLQGQNFPSAQEEPSSPRDAGRRTTMQTMVVERQRSSGEVEEEEQVMEVDPIDVPGLGSDDYPGFPVAECPHDMPDLSQHHALIATLLKEDPSIYANLRTLRTYNGVGFARCIKPGMDNFSHPMVKTAGIFAGDAESYELFRTAFDPIIAQLHRKYSPERGHVTDTDLGKVSDAKIDPSGKYVKMVSLSLNRNLADYPMCPAVTKYDREDIERLVAGALAKLEGDFVGSYLPLRGSETFIQRPGGMSVEEEDELAGTGLLFEAPDSALILAAGSGRDWPQARGIYTTSSGLTAFVNNEDHLQLMLASDGCDLRDAYRRLCEVEAGLAGSLKFAKSERLGFLGSGPEMLGTCLRAEVHVRLPKLSADKGFRQIFRRLDLQQRRGTVPGDVVLMVSNLDRLGTSEVDQVNGVIQGLRQLIAAEERLDAGETVDVSAIGGGS